MAGWLSCLPLRPLLAGEHDRAAIALPAHSSAENLQQNGGNDIAKKRGQASPRELMKAMMSGMNSECEDFLFLHCNGDQQKNEEDDAAVQNWITDADAVGISVTVSTKAGEQRRLETVRPDDLFSSLRARVEAEFDMPRSRLASLRLGEQELLSLEADATLRSAGLYDGSELVSEWTEPCRLFQMEHEVGPGSGSEKMRLRLDDNGSCLLVVIQAQKGGSIHYEVLKGKYTLKQEGSIGVVASPSRKRHGKKPSFINTSPAPSCDKEEKAKTSGDSATPSVGTVYDKALLCSWQVYYSCTTKRPKWIKEGPEACEEYQNIDVRESWTELDDLIAATHPTLGLETPAGSPGR